MTIPCYTGPLERGLALFNKEPAVILGFISAGLILATGFGLRLSGEQVNNIMMFSAAAIALFGGVVIRQQVVPTEVANKQIETAVKMPSTATIEDVKAAAKESGE